MMKNNTKIVSNPEIVIGLVGPIGIKLEPVQECISNKLRELNYTTEHIKITDLMKKFDVGEQVISNNSYSEYYQSLIKFADNFREKCEHHAALAALAIEEIRHRRSELNKVMDGDAVDDEDKFANSPSLGTAYVIRQFKLPQEVELMRQVYGRKFIQISVYLDENERKDSIISSIKGYNSQHVSTVECQTQALQLMEMDSNEADEQYGQRVTEVFHLGDVFIRGVSSPEIKVTLDRFFEAFFGSNAVSPSKDEYGMYAAAGAALRSIDLSRQVGAAIFSKGGEISSLGCNEVPKAFGGSYWDDEAGAQRDYELGSDANHDRKKEIIHDFIERLEDIDMLTTLDGQATNIGELTDMLVTNSEIKKSQLMDIIEFGRMVHAEMQAITDAARLGRALDGSTLFCTTFPCHMCAKHIVSSGIKRLVFLEPYPKSYARELHSDSISFDPKDSDAKVLFQPFIGISPRRYRDIFEKKKRKDKNGKSLKWAGEGNKPIPRIEDRSPAYIENEEPAIVHCGLEKLIPQSI